MSGDKENKLKLEIDNARMQIHTDGYPMSIGEIVNLYEDGDLDIHPEFQRVYRWSNEQKSRLIESILLGIPIPSVFVSQRDDGVWDVVDGLQRLSTILSFMGKLKDENGVQQPMLKLQTTKYLPELADKMWENQCDPNNEISSDIKRLFKREKMDVKIIKRESQGDAKFELFQRLNTGGSKLSDQEVRNCILLMLNKKAFEFIRELSRDENFINTTPVSEKKEEEAYREELILRYFIQRNYIEKSDNKETDVAPYINEELIRLFSLESTFNYENEKKIFKKTFKLLNESLEDDAFKKYNKDKNKPTGPLSVPIFEALTFAISLLVQNEKETNLDIIKDKHKQLPEIEKFKEATNRIMRPIERMSKMHEIGEGLFL